MERLPPLLLLLINLTMVFAPVVFTFWVIRYFRRKCLSQVTLSQAQVDSLRAQVLDYVKDESYNQGVMVDLSKFWHKEKVRRDADKIEVLSVLLNKAVFLVNDEKTMDWTSSWANWILLPVPREVCMSQREWQKMVNGEKSNTIVHSLYGDYVEGHKVERDYIAGDRVGGDKTGRDKAGGDARSVNESTLNNSFNRESQWDGVSTITSVSQLTHEMRRIASDARDAGLKAEIGDALEWGAERALGPQPSLAEFGPRHRVIATAGGWVGERLTQLVDASAGALAGAWVLELLK